MVVIKLVELISIMFVRYFCFFVFRKKNIPASLSGIYNKPAVIVANHTAAFDPFLITANLRWNQTFALFPYSFMMHNRFFKYLLLRPWLYCHGCFPAFPHERLEYGTEKAADLLNAGHTVVMFPEGKVMRKDRQFPPKTGIETLAKLKDVRLIPVRVRWHRKRGLFRSYSMTVGHPFSGKDMTAEQIMDVVYSLKFS